VTPPSSSNPWKGEDAVTVVAPIRKWVARIRGRRGSSHSRDGVDARDVVTAVAHRHVREALTTLAAIL